MRATRDHRGFTIIDEATGNEFYFKHPSFRKHKTIFREFSKQVESTDGDNYKAFDAMVALVSAPMTGWKVSSDDPDVLREFGLSLGDDKKPVSVSYSPDKIDLVLSSPQFNEFFELFKTEINPSLSPNSESPAPSPQAKSVATADPEAVAISDAV